MATAAGLAVADYRRFLMGANQVVVLRPLHDAVSDT